MKSSDFTGVLSSCWLCCPGMCYFLSLFSFHLGGGAFPQDVDSIFFYFRNNFLTHTIKCLLYLIIMVFFFRDSFYMYVGFIFACNILYNFSLLLFDSLSVSIYLACIYHFNPCYFLVLSVLSLPLYYFKFLLHIYVAFTFFVVTFGWALEAYSAFLVLILPTSPWHPVFLHYIIASKRWL